MKKSLVVLVSVLLICSTLTSCRIKVVKEIAKDMKDIVEAIPWKRIPYPIYRITQAVLNKDIKDSIIIYGNWYCGKVSSCERSDSIKKYNENCEDFYDVKVYWEYTSDSLFCYKPVDTEKDCTKITSYNTIKNSTGEIVKIIRSDSTITYVLGNGYLNIIFHSEGITFYHSQCIMDINNL